jgi:hypothetical protein
MIQIRKSPVQLQFFPWAFILVQYAIFSSCTTNNNSASLHLASAQIENETYCNPATENVFQINFSHIPEEIFAELPTGDFQWSLFLASTTATDNDLWYLEEIREYRSYYSHDEYAQLQTLCLSKDKCAVFLLERLPSSDLFQVQFNGEIIEPEPIFRNDSIHDTIHRWRAEMGDFCAPICSKDETLLDIDAFSPKRTLEDFNIRLEHSLRGEEIPLQGPILMPSTESRIKRCIPTNECYQRTLADETWSVYDTRADQLSVVVSTDDEETNNLANLNGFRFETLQFGTGCTKPCVTHGNMSSLFEFYISSNGYDNTKFWSLTDIKNGVEIVSGNKTGNSTTHHNLQYVQECIPSDACLEFKLWITDEFLDNANGGQGYLEMGLFRIVLDGTIYYDGYYRFERDWLEQGKRNSVETILLGHCATQETCNMETEKLFDLHLNTNGNNINDPNIIAWVVEDTHGLQADWASVFTRDSDFVQRGYFPNSSYRHLKCIPRSYCLNFEVTREDMWRLQADYYVTLDGEIIPRYLVSIEDGQLVQEKVPLGGDSCQTMNDNLPTLAIVVIVVCGSLLLLALFFTFKICGKPVVDPATGTGEEETVASDDSSNSVEEDGEDCSDPEQALSPTSAASTPPTTSEHGSST